MKTWHVIGIMSGTSMDGLDLCLCRFSYRKKQWSFHILQAQTQPYTPAWKKKLGESRKIWEQDILQLHFDYGRWIGRQVKNFMKKVKVRVDLIASHGHTALHRPDIGITVQLGDGASIAREARITTVCNFRHRDIALGGQGAPLVPIGDELLFAEYHYCLNLGGFSNVSFRQGNQRIAFDISPVNIILNRISQQYWGLPYDGDGRIGQSGNVDDDLLYDLNILPYYHYKPPKSLGAEWVDEYMAPLVKRFTGTPEDLLRTLYEHMAFQVGTVLHGNPGKTVLVTGGGAFNPFLMDRIQQHTNCSLHIPDPLLVKYKEALVFGLMGVLRILGKNNCLASATGARHDCSGGFVYYI